MYEALALLELSLWLGLPAWIANAMPVIFGGGRPMDGGRVFSDGYRILGDGKTVRGFLVGVFLGTLTGVAQYLSAPYILPVMQQFVTVSPEMEYVLFMTIPAGILLSTGALIGDLFGSFLKRRVNVQSGAPSPILDQLGFIIMALMFAYPLLQPDSAYVAILIVMTLGIHWLSNTLGYLVGLKENPW
ncbi:MAG: CDP-2,3-bis-(O-geranylgeranyl)-sn-glycerol synthase [Candidatus Thorarchaeota archaeon]|jgi:CDP-2,3-bis-(O-geranylgeranyl)-sn-glycerol synthase